MRRAAPCAAQWENCSSTKIWYAKGTQRAPASAGRSRKDQTGTFMLYSEIGDNSDAQIWRLLIGEKMDQYRTHDYNELLNQTPTLANLLSILYC